VRIRALAVLSALVVFAAAQWPVTIPLDTFHPPFADPSFICYSPASNHVYVSCWAYRGDTNVAVLDGSTLGRIGAIPTGANRVRCIAYNGVHNKVYAGSGEGGNAVAVVNCDNDSVLAVLQNIGLAPGAMCVNPLNGKVHVASSPGSSVAIIDGAGDTVLAMLNVGFSPVALCANTRDNKVYAAISSDSIVTVIDGMTDEVIKTIRVGVSPHSLAYAKLQNRIYCANRNWYSSIDSTVSVIDGGSDSVVATIIVGLGPCCVCYDSSTNKLYCAVRSYYDETGYISVINCNTNSVIRTIPVRSDGLAGDASRHVLYSVNDLTNTVDFIDCLTDSVIADLPTGKDPWWQVCPIPSNGTVLVSAPGSDDVTAYDAATRQVTARTPLEIQAPRAVASLADTSLVYVACGLNTLAAIDGTTNKVCERLNVGMYPSALVYSPLSGHLYCANTGGNGFYPESTVSVVDPAQNRVLKDIVVGPAPSLLSYNDVEGKVYVAGRDMVVRTIDVRTDSVVHEATLDSLPQSMVFASSINRLFIATRWANRCALWVIDGSSDSVVAVYSPVSAYTCRNVALGWNPDAKKAYLFYWYQFARSVAVWDAMADTLTRTFSLPLTVLSSAYDPTDSTLYAGSDGGILCMIDGVGDSLIGKLVCAQCAGDQYLCFSPTTSRLYFTNASSANVGVVKKRGFVGRVPAGSKPALAHVASNGIVYVANAGSGDITAFPDTIFVGLEEAQPVDRPRDELRATVVSRNLLIPATPLGSTITCALLDVVGRLVTDLHPGINDISGLSPGVYFLKERRADCNGISQRIGKVVVAR
jgi:YVTN family beta-propeller protein